jgi:hypothetical protein
MPVYFFDTLIDGGLIVKDDEGIALADLEAVMKEAITSAREQIADAAKQGFDIFDRRFQVRNESGEIVFSVNFGDVLRRR